MARTCRGTGEDNREKIREAAMVLIADQGVDRTSLAMVAKASGLSKGTLYYYYASKADLVFDIADHHMEKITRDILKAAPLTETGPRPRKNPPPGRDQEDPQRVRALLTAYFEILLGSQTRSRLHLYLIREAMADPPSLGERFQDTYARWFSLIDQVQARDLPPAPHPRLLSRFLVALVEGFILQRVLGVEETRVEDMVELAMKVVLPPPKPPA